MKCLPWNLILLSLLSAVTRFNGGWVERSIHNSFIIYALWTQTHMLHNKYFLILKVHWKYARRIWCTENSSICFWTSPCCTKQEACTRRTKASSEYKISVNILAALNFKNILKPLISCSTIFIWKSSLRIFSFFHCWLWLLSELFETNVFCIRSVAAPLLALNACSKYFYSCLNETAFKLRFPVVLANGNLNSAFRSFLSIQTQIKLLYAR